jgi:hypothetical protein
MASKVYSPSNVQRDSVNRRTSKMRSRLISLRQSWRWSLPRIVVHEIYSLPCRISAILAAPSLRYGPEIPRGMLDRSKESFDRENRFQLSCIESMEQLQSENRWAGYLEMQMAAKSFQRGALWAYRNFCSETEKCESSMPHPLSESQMSSGRQ